MHKPARPFRSLGLSAVALCLAASFGLSVSGFQSTDRAARQQQRSRLQRSPRHRICPGISQEPCTLQVAFVKSFQAADPPPEFVGEFLKPVFQSVELVLFPTLAQPRQEPVCPSSLPRPPPSNA